MNLLEICDNLVCRNHILSFLEVNDLLRLRRVCKLSKAQSEDFIRTQKVQTQRPLEVDLSDIDQFALNNYFENVSGLPSRTKASFSDCESTQYRLARHLLQNFVDSYGSNITHLTFVNLEISFYSKRILTFFKPFPNVTHLVLDMVSLIQRVEDGRSKTDSAISKGVHIPPSLKGLKMLEIQSSNMRLSSYSHRCILLCTEKLVDTCISNLEQLSICFDEFVHYERDRIIRLACKYLFSAPNLKLKDVDGEFIEHLLRTDNRTLEMGSLDAMINIINAKVTSVHYYHEIQPRAFVLELPNLEELLSRYGIPDPGVEKCEWPRLKKITTTFQSGDFDSPGNRQLWDLFFGGMTRENVVVLDIHITLHNNSEAIPSENMRRTRNLVKSCPNLKTLKIGGDMNQLLALPGLWRGLPHLQKLCFYGCHSLTSANFIGEDADNPAFWSLKNLKILKFRRTTVTDDLFSRVLLHLPLRELCLFTIGSRDENHKTTLDGIKSLLTGTFATTIEKFSIIDLNLDGVTTEEMKAVENLFRSSKMI